jgi:Cys-tRNA(Pro)/Cys-tRNA(Cys) deacylase
VILPSDREVNLKRLAAALGGKGAQMMKPADAERITGYHVGGISPFGQKKRVPTVLEQSALEHAEVFINGGQRGLQVKLAPHAAAEALEAKVAEVV